MNAQQKVNTTSNLTELCELLNIISAEQLETGVSDISHIIDIYNLPNFGGTNPTDTAMSPVFSWDKTHVLLANSYWYVEKRCFCGEASCHCVCKTKIETAVKEFFGDNEFMFPAPPPESAQYGSGFYKLEKYSQQELVDVIKTAHVEWWNDEEEDVEIEFTVEDVLKDFQHTRPV